jgi:hypothetical protein
MPAWIIEAPSQRFEVLYQQIGTPFATHSFAFFAAKLLILIASLTPRSSRTSSDPPVIALVSLFEIILEDNLTWYNQGWYASSNGFNS